MLGRQLFNEGWMFTQEPLDTTLQEVNERGENFKLVSLPMIG